MNIKSLILSIILLTFGQANASQDATVECYYRFTDSVIEITPEMRVNGCTADFIWGFDNVCFRGSAKSLVKLINSDFYTWRSSLRVEDASVVNKDVVEYTGVDARNFYSATRTIERCD